MPTIQSFSKILYTLPILPPPTTTHGDLNLDKQTKSNASWCDLHRLDTYVWSLDLGASLPKTQWLSSGFGYKYTCSLLQCESLLWPRSGLVRWIHSEANFVEAYEVTAQIKPRSPWQAPNVGSFTVATINNSGNGIGSGKNINITCE
jgi:hypothetical protein